MKFSKELAKYYDKWYRDCHDSVIYCKEQGDTKRAELYLNRANLLFDLINENWYQIEFYRIGDNAFLHTWAQFAKYNEMHPNEFKTEAEFVKEFCK